VPCATAFFHPQLVGAFRDQPGIECGIGFHACWTSGRETLTNISCAERVRRWRKPRHRQKRVGIPC
jgi:hypothetical protein